MKNNLCLFFCVISVYTSSFSIAQNNNHQSLNNYVDFINIQTDYVSKMMYCLHQYHQDIERFKKSGQTLAYFKTYVCSNQLERYNYEKAINETTSQTLSLKAEAEAFWQVMESLDKKCKDIEIYVRLEEYKNKDFSKSDLLLKELVKEFEDFSVKKKNLYQAIERLFNSLYPPGQNSYQQASSDMVIILEREAALMDQWSFNFNQQFHTGWIVEKITENVNANQNWLSKYENQFPFTLQYPADHAVKTFVEGVATMQETKRSGIDDYNMEAKKDDEHANQEYDYELNYYNNVLVSFYNQFCDYSNQGGIKILKYVEYSPLFEFKTNDQGLNINVKPFDDKSYPELVVPNQSTVISKQSLNMLNNYLDYINEAVFYNKPLIWTLSDYQQSAERYRTMTDYTGKAPLTYTFDSYKIPLSTFAKSIDESRLLPDNARQTINTQLEVLQDILKEIEQWILVLQQYTKNKEYEIDKLQKSDEIVKRFEILLNAFDDKKEKLYLDVRKIYESYPTVPAENNWQKSGKALLDEVDEAHVLLFKSKDFFKGKSTNIPETVRLEELTKSLIVNEYSNMGKIVRIGRSNGLCPYTPYEDIPESALLLIKKVKELPTIKVSEIGRHPYEDYAYRYNDMIEDYNKFTTLAEINLLKNVLQPDFFLRKSKSVAKVPDPVEEIEFDNSSSMDGYAINNLVLLLDVSGSMSEPDKLPLLKKSFKSLLTILRAEDEVSIVVYSGTAKVLLNPTSAQEISKISKLIDKLKSEGSTNSEAGIQLAYQTVNQRYDSEKNNRIILATDGEFKISNSSMDLIQKNAGQGNNLSIFHFGKNQAIAENLKKIVEKGGGRFANINGENIDLTFLKEVKAKKIK